MTRSCELFRYSTDQGKLGRRCAVDRRVQKTRKAIQKAYLSLLMEKRSEKISVSEITREADIDRKTFYLHYGSIQDVIREYSEQKTKAILQQLAVRSFFTLHFDRKIFSKEATALILTNIDFLKVLAESPDLDFFWDTAQETTVKTLTEIYARHSRLPESSLRIQVSYFVGGAGAVLKDWLLHRIDCSLEEMADQVSGIAFTGVQAILRTNQEEQGKNAPAPRSDAT